MRHATSLALATLIAGCEPSAPMADAGPGRPATAWPAADALFHREPRWLGADAAYSVDLGGDRVLWLFGDTFIATSDAHVRRASRLVRNTVAVQDGLCPATASITFHWNEDGEGVPTSYFAEDGEIWRWPLHGVVIDGALTLFWMRERPTGTGLGFETAGWEAVRIEDVSGDPSGWSLTPLAGFESPFTVAVGTAILAEGEHVYAYAVEEPGSHDVYLLRWERAAFVAGDLTAPSWWNEGAWSAHASLTDAPTAVFGGAQSELSVSRVGGEVIAVHSLGFGRTTVGVRSAPELTGPFGAARTVFRPEESDRDDAFVYAAKAHPELGCPETEGELLVTYAANATDFATLLDDETLYYPRFVRIPLSP